MIDWFGLAPTITETESDECIVEVDVNREAFFWWAMQYGFHVEVLEPCDIRERIREATRQMWEKYK